MDFTAIIIAIVSASGVIGAAFVTAKARGHTPLQRVTEPEAIIAGQIEHIHTLTQERDLARDELDECRSALIGAQ